MLRYEAEKSRRFLAATFSENESGGCLPNASASSADGNTNA